VGILQKILGADGVNQAKVDANGNLAAVSPIVIQAFSLAANGALQGVTIPGYIGIGVQVTSIGGGGTLQFEGSGSGSAGTWQPLSGVPNPNGPSVSSTTAAGAWQFDGTGVPFFQVRLSAYTSGTITGYIILTPNSSIVMLEGGNYAVALAGSEPCIPVRNIPICSPLTISATAAANTGLTVTLPSAGAGLYHYITGIEITRNATAALIGSATLVITTTNLPGSRAWSVGNAMALGGTQIDVNITRNCAIKSSVAATATTIVMPAPGLAVLWRCNVDYYIGT
jgi:hypothetical protein